MERTVRAGKPEWLPLAVLSAVTALLVLGGSLLWAQEARRGAQKPRNSVLRTDGDGAALVYRLYQSVGLRPRIWDRELTHLSGPGLLILLAPAQPRTLGARGPAIGSDGELLPPEIRALDDWVKEGSVAVIMAREDNPLYHALGLILDEPAGVSASAAEPVQPGLLARGVAALQTQTHFGYKYGRKKNPMLQKAGLSEPPEPVAAIPATEWVELFVKKSPPRVLPQVVTAARGKGLYVAVNDVFPAGNVGLPLADNARFMLNLARLNPPGGTVWFDEYHKRNAERGLVTYLRERALAPALIYIVLLVGLLFWRTSIRFGAAEPLVADERRDSGEYVRAVASLYRNAAMARDSLAVIYADFGRRAGRSRGVDARGEAAEVARRYEQRSGRPGAEVLQLLGEVEAALAAPHLEEAIAVRLAGRLAQLDSVLAARESGGRWKVDAG